jgi:hypothetical protein
MAGRLGTIAPTVRSDPPAWLRRAPFWIWGLVLMLICPPLTVVVAGVAGFRLVRWAVRPRRSGVRPADIGPTPHEVMLCADPACYSVATCRVGGSDLKVWEDTATQAGHVHEWEGRR